MARMLETRAVETDRAAIAARKLNGCKAHKASSSESSDWPDPKPLPDPLPTVPEFDLTLLPDALRGWVNDIAERIQCSVDFPAVGAMVALAAVVGRQVGIRPRRHDDWLVVPNLWAAIIGRPGLLKSPALAEVMRPLQRLEMRAREEYEQKLRQHGAQQMVAAQAKKEIEKQIKIALSQGDDSEALRLAKAAVNSEEEKAQRRRYLTQDPTVEKLGELLAANPRGVLIFRDELTGWLRSMDRKGHECARAFYLEAWNGTGGYVIDRIGRGTIDIEAACVSILGGIQPGPLSAYLKGALGGGIGDDGFLQRLQLVVWPDASSEWRDVDRPPDVTAREAAWATFERLDRIDRSAIGAECTNEGVPWLRLCPAAQEKFSDWRARLEVRLRAGTEHRAFEAVLAKYRSLVPSLALLIHLATVPEGGPVTENAMLAAIGWSKYLEGHAKRLYAPALDPALHAACELGRHLRADDLECPFQARTVYLKGWRLLDTKEAADEALEYLAKLGWVRAEPVDTGGRPRTDWYINPKLRAVV